MKNLTENVEAGGRLISKVARYGWKFTDKPGAFMMIAKDRLQVLRSTEDGYQRDSTPAKVLQIAANFSWLAFNTLVVARCSSGLFVVDGGNRLDAALRRSDISELPCMVHDVETIEGQAKGFLVVNTLRKPVSAYQKFRAERLSGDPIASFVASLIQSSGRRAAAGASDSTVACLSLLKKMASSNREALIKVWPVAVELCEGQHLHETMVKGLMWIEARMPIGQSLADERWATRLHDLGFQVLLRAAQQSALLHGKGGERIYGLGMLQAINKSLRTKLRLQKVEDPIESDGFR